MGLYNKQSHNVCSGRIILVCENHTITIIYQLLSTICSSVGETWAKPRMRGSGVSKRRTLSTCYTVFALVLACHAHLAGTFGCRSTHVFQPAPLSDRPALPLQCWLAVAALHSHAPLRFLALSTDAHSAVMDSSSSESEDLGISDGVLAGTFRGTPGASSPILAGRPISCMAL